MLCFAGGRALHLGTDEVLVRIGVLQSRKPFVPRSESCTRTKIRYKWKVVPKSERTLLGQGSSFSSQRESATKHSVKRCVYSMMGRITCCSGRTNNNLCASQFVADNSSSKLSAGRLEDKAHAVTSYFSRGEEWFFIDTKNQRQGPFTGEDMSTWFRAGYFWDKNLMMSHAGWSKYVPLEELIKTAEEILTAEQNGATQKTKHEDDDADSLASDEKPEWYYLDKGGIPQGPFSTVQMIEWYDSKQIPKDAYIRHIDPEFKYFVRLNLLFDDDTVFDYPENWSSFYWKAVKQGNCKQVSI